MGPEAYPSGHTTAVMSLALALVIVSPSRWRPLAAAAGGLLTVATVFSILVHGGHYPSDIVGGFLVATGWAYLGAAVAARRGAAEPRAARRSARAVLAALGALVVAAARPADALNYAVANTTFVARRAGDRRRGARAQRKRPGSHSGSAPPAATFTPRERMNSRSLSRLR